MDTLAEDVTFHFRHCCESEWMKECVKLSFDINGCSAAGPRRKHQRTQIQVVRSWIISVELLLQSGYVIVHLVRCGQGYSATSPAGIGMKNDKLYLEGFLLHSVH